MVYNAFIACGRERRGAMRCEILKVVVVQFHVYVSRKICMNASQATTSAWRIFFAMAPPAAKLNFYQLALRSLDQGDDAPPNRCGEIHPSFPSILMPSEERFHGLAAGQRFFCPHPSVPPA
jgi:hypothetical protein